MRQQCRYPNALRRRRTIFGFSSTCAPLLATVATCPRVHRHSISTSPTTETAVSVYPKLGSTAVGSPIRITWEVGMRRAVTYVSWGVFALVMASYGTARADNLFGGPNSIFNNPGQITGG